MDEEADLALLDQHLIKTNLLSQRMTGILAQLDTRLSRLDKTIAPLGIQPLTRKADNIDAALAALSPNPPSTSSASINSRSQPAPRRPQAQSTSSSSGLGIKGYSLQQSNLLSPIASAAPSGTGSPADETAILTRGPDIMALGEYFAALDGVVGDLERMWKGFKEGRGGAREAGVKDLSRMVEIGFAGLTQLFLKISRDNMGRTIDIENAITSGAPTPPNYFPPLQTLVPVAARISNMISPSSPTPKTATVIGPLHDEFINTLSEARGEYIRRSFSGLITKVEEVDEGGIWESGRAGEKVKGLVRLWEGLVVVIEAETLLITTLFPSRPPPQLLPQSISQPLSLISQPLTQTLNTIKRSLSTHSFLALDLYQSILRLQGRWEQAVSKCLQMTNSMSIPSSKDLLNALTSPLATLKSLAQRSFPELLVDIRSPPPGQSQSAGTSSSIHPTTYSTLTYLETLPTYQSAISGLLGGSRSERTWLMGAKEPPSSVRSAQEEGGIVNLFVADVLGTLIGSLEGMARGMRRPVGQTFLLNNLSHVRNTTASFNSDIIGPGAEDMLNKAFRDAKSQYINEITSSLLTALSTAQQTSTPRFGVAVNASSTERQHLKEGCTAFFDRLGELENVTRQHPLSRGDIEMRERVGREITDLISGAYGGFWGKCQGKNVEKYLRNTPDEVVRKVQGMFR